ncbi:MAG: hypothetical protein II945_00180 [Bacteroidales bacterium]|nr:hypothetical protein [Bacteroidales bacterium]
MKKIIIAICCLVGVVALHSCDEQYEKWEYPMCVVVKTADQTMEYELSYPVNNKTEKIKSQKAQGTDALLFRYVRDMKYVNEDNNNFVITLSMLTTPKEPAEVCVYKYKSRLNVGELEMCNLKGIIDDENAGKKVEISSDSVFNILKEKNYKYLYTWDETNKNLIIKLNEIR